MRQWFMRPQAERCAGGNILAMRCRFAPILIYPTLVMDDMLGESPSSRVGCAHSRTPRHTIEEALRLS
jgi:hypothetical protein